MGLDCRCSSIAVDRVSDRCRLEQQQHDRQQWFVDNAADDDDDDANDAPAGHHGFRRDVNATAIAACVDTVDTVDDGGASQAAITSCKVAKSVPALLGAGTDLEFRRERSAENGMDSEAKCRACDRLYRLKFNS